MYNKIKYSTYQTIIFCAFIISGGIKFVFTYYQFPIDITLFFAVLILVDIIYSLIFANFILQLNKLQATLLILFFLFYITMILSLSYSLSNSYGYKKTLYFLFCVVAFIYPIFIKHFNIKLLFKLTLITTIPASFYFIFLRYCYYSGYTNLVQPNFKPLLGAYGGLALLISVLSFYYAEHKKFKMYAFSVILLLALGARAPLLFILIITLIWKRNLIYTWLISLKIPSKISYSNIFFLIIVAPLLFIFRSKIMLAFKDGLFRFASLANFENDNSSKERIEFYMFSFNKIIESLNSLLLGYGIGSFSLLFTGKEGRKIPHNIYLEAWFELGITGLVLIILISIIPLFLKNRNQIIKMIAIFLFLDSMKSGAFDEMRFMFGIYGILIFTKNDNTVNKNLK